MRKLFFISIFLMTLSSCDDGNNNAATKAENGIINAPISFMPSLEFIKNIEGDNFYEKDQKGKIVSISNLIVLRYIIDSKDVVRLECAAYSPEQKVYNGFCVACDWSYPRGLLIGNELYSDIGNAQSYIFVLYLKNRKDVKNISFYVGTSRTQELEVLTTPNNFIVKDVISMTGVFKGKGEFLGNSLEFDDCEFSITNTYIKNTAIINSVSQKEVTDYNDMVVRQREKYVRDSIELGLRIDSENHAQENSKN